jgi:hypothetical protein
MAYKPSGHAAKFIDELVRRGPMAEMSAGEGAEFLRLSTNHFAQAMTTPLLRGCVHRERRGLHVFYRIAPYPNSADGKSGDFSATRFSDGDLALYGIEELEDGGYLLRAAQVCELLRLLSAYGGDA